MGRSGRAGPAVAWKSPAPTLFRVWEGNSQSAIKRADSLALLRARRTPVASLDLSSKGPFRAPIRGPIEAPIEALYGP